MKKSTEILKELNAYENEKNIPEGINDNVWGDIIEFYDLEDCDYTDEPTSDQFQLQDGRRFIYDARSQEWKQADDAE